jgi:hypothetical protein
VKSLLILEAEIADSVVHSVESVGERIVQRVSGVSKPIGLLVKLGDQGLLIYCGAHICLRSGCAATSSSTAKSKPSAAVAEQEKDDDPSPIVAKHTVVVVSTTSANVGGTQFISHTKIPFFCFLFLLRKVAPPCSVYLRIMLAI